MRALDKIDKKYRHAGQVLEKLKNDTEQSKSFVDEIKSV